VRLPLAAKTFFGALAVSGKNDGEALGFLDFFCYCIFASD